MANKVLSIEVGQGLTRIVEMDYKAKNPKIYNCFTFITPKGVVNDGVVSCTDTFISLMKTECSKWGIRTKKAVFSVTSSRIANREVKLPLVKDKQIQEVLNANASDFFPVDMNQYHLSYKVLKKVNTKEEKSLYLNVLAVPNEITNSYMAFSQAIGLTILSIDYVGNSIVQAMTETFANNEVHAVIKAEERSTLITIVSEGEVKFQRVVKQGIEPAIDVVRKTPVFGNNLTYGDAINVLCGKSCIRRQLHDTEIREEEDIDTEMMTARIRVTQSLAPLISATTRMLEYYQDSNNISKIDNIHLIGLGGDFSGLGRIMSSEMQQKVRVYRGVEGSSIEKNVRDERFSASSYIACIGSAINPLNLMTELPKKGLRDVKSLKDLKSPKAIDPVVLGSAVFLIGLVAGLAMAAFSLSGYFGIKDEVEDLRAHVEQLKGQGVEIDFNEYVRLGALSAELQDMYDMTLSRSEELVAFIEELEDKMPSSIIVMNFSANSQGVSMSMTVDSKEAVAKTLMQLKSFESIDVVSSSGLTESKDENGDTTVSFSVDLTYNPVLTEREKQAIAEAEAAAAAAAEDENADAESTEDTEGTDTTTETEGGE